MDGRPHEHDEKWVESQIMLLSARLRAKAVDGYRSVFLDAYNSEPVPHKKMNVARRAANMRLMAFVKNNYNK